MRGRRIARSVCGSGGGVGEGGRKELERKKGEQKSEVIIEGSRITEKG